MGGMTALGIMTRHREVKCGASLMGSGYFTGLARTLFPPLSPQNPAQQAEFDNIIAPLREWEVTHQLERLADRPLLFGMVRRMTWCLLSKPSGSSRHSPGRSWISM